MKKIKKYNLFKNGNQGQGPRPVKCGTSIFEVLEAVKRQIEADCFYERDIPMVNELALIIAEVLCLPEDARVRISGSDLPATMVAEVYGKLTGEHIETVIESFRRADYEIKHKKTYLRTALYVSVFETQSSKENGFY